MITDNRKTEMAIPKYLTDALPIPVSDEVCRLLRTSPGTLEEIRLRSEKFCEYRVDGQSLRGKYAPDGDTMNETLFRLCGGSVYAHGDTICDGYVKGKDGIRIGVVGHAVCQGEKITAVRNVSALNIRIPTPLRRFAGVGTPYPELAQAAVHGLLICSPPGIGKTTALRYTARTLAGTGHRVAVVDSRGELAYGLEAPGLSVDIMDGYPRAKGIEIAIRTMCPDVLACDEIGNEDDVAALMTAVGAGVAVLATAHAASMAEAVGRQGISRLIEKGVFGTVAFLERNGSGRCKCMIDEVARP